MRLKTTIIVITTLLLFIHNYSIKAQDKNGSIISIDTIKEKIVYEYDTVYVAPDTLKLTDTIVYYQAKSNSIKEKKKFNFIGNLNPLQNFNEKWSIGIGVNAIILELNDKNRMIDSFNIQKTMNFSYEFHLNYDLNRFRYSLGLGFASYHEQLEYQKILNQNSPITSIGSYDSLSVTNKCTANNYYQYLNIFFNLGKKWGKGPFFFVLNSYISGNILINYSAFLPTNPPIQLNSNWINKIDYRIGINPSIGYKLMKKTEISLGPFGNYSFFSSKKYPSISHMTIGITFRVQ